MEVHHHPHVGKKNFKEYLLEGLMIFLAVSMGFIAENIREHFSDKSKEKEIIESLVEDLHLDQKYLNEQHNYFTEKLQELDSLTTILNTKDKITNTNGFYYFGRLATRYTTLVLNTGSIDEIKNSGGLRLIRKKGIAKKIIEYYNQISIIKYYEERLMVIDDSYRKVFVDIIDPSVLQSMYSNKDGRIGKPIDNPALRNYSKDNLSTLYGYVDYMHILRNVIAGREADLEAKGKKLLTLIQNEYHLEKE